MLNGCFPIRIFQYTTLANRSGYFGSIRSRIKVAGTKCGSIVFCFIGNCIHQHLTCMFSGIISQRHVSFKKIKFYLSLAILEFSPYTETFEICFIPSVGRNFRSFGKPETSGIQ